MQFPELDPYRDELPQLSNELSRLETYLSEVARPTPRGRLVSQREIAPIQVANRLDVDEGIALILLNYCERAGIVTHHYDMLCPNTELVITTSSSKAELPPSVNCPYEIATEHTINDYFVELVFNFSPSFVDRHIRNRLAAR
jgi:hypothetical protein